MTRFTRHAFRVTALLGVALAGMLPALSQCKVTESTRLFEGAQRQIITLENERVMVEVAPTLEGRIISYRDKLTPKTPFEWLDDCPYHYGARWEGKPFTYQITEQTAERASVTVTGGGKISVSLMKYATGLDVAVPVDMKVERTMTIEKGSSRLRVDIKFTNVGEGIAPRFRNMVHTVIGCVPAMPNGGRAFWFLPTANGVEFFDPVRGEKDMWAAISGSDPSFSRFTPGVKADKPRYEAGGWGAVLTSCGPVYIYYDPAKYDFMQFWFGGDAEWHFTYEPHTKPIDLKPGESTTGTFTLAFDSKDVPFNTPTVSYEQPTVPAALQPGATLHLNVRATTVRGTPEQAKVAFEVKDSAGQVILAKEQTGEVQPFVFSPMNVETKLADNATTGIYTWKMTRGDGLQLATGHFEVVSAQELAKREMEKATAELRAQIDKLTADNTNLHNDHEWLVKLWKEDANIAWGLTDPTAWPAHVPNEPIALQVAHNVTPVLGLWQATELPRLTALAAVPVTAWPADPQGLLGALKADRALVRDVAVAKDGKSLAALLVDPGKRAEVVLVSDAGVVKRMGRYADKPGESDDTLGAVARAVAVDADGNIWVTTNAWGKTSIFRTNQDGSPYEESVISDKGAVKKFSPTGQLLGTLSLLDTPIDLVCCQANGTPALLVPYRNVSQYHGAQVREGVMLVRAADVQRIGELKVPAGTISIDEAGRIWTADVAGHITCSDLKGKKLLEVATSPAPAIPDSRLPATSPAPVVLRADGKGHIWALYTLGRKLVDLDATGAPHGDATPVPDTAGNLYRATLTPAGILSVGDKLVWKP